MVEGRFGRLSVSSEVDCNREEGLELDELFARLSGLPDRPRGGWSCNLSLFVLEDDYAFNQEVETEIAFATYNIGDDDVCEIVDMEVAKAFRGRGLGRRLVEEVLSDMRLKHGAVVYLYAYEPDEGSLEGFFSRFGFQMIEVPEEEWSAGALPSPMEHRLVPTD